MAPVAELAWYKCREVQQFITLLAKGLSGFGWRTIFTYFIQELNFQHSRSNMTAQHNTTAPKRGELTPAEREMLQVTAAGEDDAFIPEV